VNENQAWDAFLVTVTANVSPYGDARAQVTKAAQDVARASYAAGFAAASGEDEDSEKEPTAHQGHSQGAGPC
jgi:hypothetical protein